MNNPVSLTTSSNQFIIEPEKLKACLVSITNNDINSKEAEKYLNECEKYPNYLIILLDMFESLPPSEDITKLQSFIAFKNVIMRNWNNKPNGRGVLFIPEEYKAQIRAILVSFLDKYQQKLIRDQINSCLQFISRSDFPTNFGQLYQYFLKNIDALKNLITSEDQLFNPLTKNFLRTLKLIIKEQTRRRGGSGNKKVFFDYSYNILAGFKDIWTYLSLNFKNMISGANKQNMDKVILYIQLMRYADRIMTQILCTGYMEMHTEPQLVLLARELLSKSVEYLEIIKQLQGCQGLRNLNYEVNRNLRVIIYNLANIQSLNPFLFRDILADYLQLGQIIMENIEWFSERVVKSSLVSLIKVLRCYHFYCEPTKFGTLFCSPSKPDNNFSIQIECHELYYQIFNEKTIEKYFNYFILKVFPYGKNITQQADLDSQVENENENYLDETIGELENSIYNLTMAALESFFTRFIKVSVVLASNLVSNLFQNNLNEIPEQFQDGIFAMIGLIPKIFEKEKIPSSEFIDIKIILKYLSQKATTNVLLAKRIPIICSRWIKLLDPISIAEVTNIIIELMKLLDDSVIRYECCICLISIIKADSGLKIDYGFLIEAVTPIIIQLFEKFLSASTIWRLVNLLNLILEKSQWAVGSELLIKSFNTPGLLNLLKADSDFLCSALIDMFKNLFISFPQNTILTPIYRVSIQFINNGLQKGRYESFLKFWLFILKEYTHEQGLDNEITQLFLGYFGILVDKIDHSDWGTFLGIIEEYILLEIIKPDQYPEIIKLIESKYELTLQAGYNELTLDIRTGCLSIMATILLIYMNIKMYDHIKLFERLILYCLQDIMMPINEKAIKGIQGFKTSVISMLNRFILQDTNYIISLCQQYTIEISTFVSQWIANMEFLSSKHACKLNAIAILQFFHVYTDVNLIKQHMEIFFKYILPEVNNYIETIGQTKNESDKIYKLTSYARLSENRISQRKKSLRETHLYEELNLKDLFKSFIKLYGITLADLQAQINDQGILENFSKLLQNKMIIRPNAHRLALMNSVNF